MLKHGPKLVPELFEIFGPQVGPGIVHEGPKLFKKVPTLPNLVQRGPTLVHKLVKVAPNWFKIGHKMIPSCP